MPARATVNTTQLKFLVEKQITQTRAFRQAALAKANNLFATTKEEFLESFDDNSITEEIKDGPEATSSFLPGDYGNLFSFLGFPAGSEPTDDLREFLDANIRLIKEPVTGERTYTFRVRLPSKEDLASATPMPWGTSRSWLYAIEKGIPGFNKYFFDLSREFDEEVSRSGPAVQFKKPLRSGSFAGRGYITPLLAAFRRNLKDEAAI